MTGFKFTKLVLPAACAFGLLAGPALAQSTPATNTAGTAASASSTVPNAPAAPTAAAPGTMPGAAPAPVPATTTPSAPAKMSKSGKARLPANEKFSTAAAASASCPGDTVVWSTMTKSKSFHVASSKYYGKTKHGAYVCEKAAMAAGFHQSKA